MGGRARLARLRGVFSQAGGQRLLHQVAIQPAIHRRPLGVGGRSVGRGRVAVLGGFGGGSGRRLTRAGQGGPDPLRQVVEGGGGRSFRLEGAKPSVVKRVAEGLGDRSVGRRVGQRDRVGPGTTRLDPERIRLEGHPFRFELGVVQLASPALGPERPRPDRPEIFRAKAADLAVDPLGVARQQVQASHLEQQAAFDHPEGSSGHGVRLRRGADEPEPRRETERDVGPLEDQLVEPPPLLRFEEILDPVVDHDLAAHQLGAAGQLGRLDDRGRRIGRVGFERSGEQGREREGEV